MRPAVRYSEKPVQPDYNPDKRDSEESTPCLGHVDSVLLPNRELVRKLLVVALGFYAGSVKLGSDGSVTS